MRERQSGTDDRECALCGGGNTRHLCRPTGDVPEGGVVEREERGETWDSVDGQTAREQWEEERGARAACGDWDADRVTRERVVMVVWVSRRPGAEIHLQRLQRM